MATAPAQLPLTPDQQRRLAELSSKSGMSYGELLDTWISESLARLDAGEFHVRDTYDAVSAVFGEAGWDDPRMDVYNED